MSRIRFEPVARRCTEAACRDRDRSLRLEVRQVRRSRRDLMKSVQYFSAGLLWKGGVRDDGSIRLSRYPAALSGVTQAAVAACPTYGVETKSESPIHLE
jgi:hypothetical protein